MAMAKNARIEFDGESGRLYVDGEEFPYDVVDFELNTVSTGVHTLTVAIPLKEGARVIYTHGLPPLREVELEPDTADADVEHGKVGDVFEVVAGTPEPDRRFVLKRLHTSSVSRFLHSHGDDRWVWSPSESDAGDRDKGWIWSDIRWRCPGLYQIVGRTDGVEAG